MAIPNIISLVIMAYVFRKLIKDFDLLKINNKFSDYSWTFDNKRKDFFKNK